MQLQAQQSQFQTTLLAELTNIEQIYRAELQVREEAFEARHAAHVQEARELLSIEMARKQAEKDTELANLKKEIESMKAQREDEMARMEWRLSKHPEMQHPSEGESARASLALPHSEPQQPSVTNFPQKPLMSNKRKYRGIGRRTTLAAVEEVGVTSTEQMTEPATDNEPENVMPDGPSVESTIHQAEIEKIASILKGSLHMFITRDSGDHNKPHSGYG
ncbi:hypothetical protein K439DRAFT_1613811 [Ramaria rubella]|nr:hypothetical protein K439DRAFT_1613811 [Ramaria rubella]